MRHVEEIAATDVDLETTKWKLGKIVNRESLLSYYIEVNDKFWQRQVDVDLPGNYTNNICCF